jgi:hypothetical protein
MRQSTRLMAILTPFTVDTAGHDDPGQKVFKSNKDVASIATLHTCVDEHYQNSYHVAILPLLEIAERRESLLSPVSRGTLRYTSPVWQTATLSARVQPSNADGTLPWVELPQVQ